jgi:hypothetical protein
MGERELTDDLYMLAAACKRIEEESLAGKF